MEEEPKERIVGISKAYLTGNPASVVVVIPKEARDQLGKIEGHRFLVKLDDKDRIIYEPLEDIPTPSEEPITVKK